MLPFIWIKQLSSEAPQFPELRFAAAHTEGCIRLFAPQGYLLSGSVDKDVYPLQRWNDAKGGTQR